MNIFVLDYNIRQSAQFHCDIHLSKLATEAAQLLCTAVNHSAGQQITPYKSTHINHPCAIWARECVGNFEYLWELMLELDEERKHRFASSTGTSKPHLSVIKLQQAQVLDLGRYYLKPGVATTQPACMPEDVAVVATTHGIVEAYRDYYRVHKSHLHKWTKRDRPWWITK